MGRVGAQGVYRVQSPNHQIEAAVTVRDGVTYSVRFQGKPLLLDSAFALEFRDAPPIRNGLRVRENETKRIRARWENRFGKRRNVTDNANELHLNLEERDGLKRKFAMVFRASDDGLAFRYVLPKQPNLNRFVLTNEQAQFRFAGQPTVWAANYGPASAQEALFPKAAMTSLAENAYYGTPLLVQANPKAYIGLTEADLQDWAGMYLRGSAAGYGEKRFESARMRGGESAKSVRVPLAGVRRLTLTVGDGGDDFQFDHADWGDARLITKDGQAVPLSDLTPAAATQGFGTLQKNRSVDGNPLRIGDKTYASGLGTHSIGTLTYELDKEYARFEAEVGIDAEAGTRGSVIFAVYGAGANTDTPAALTTLLTPRRDGNGVVVSETPRRSPWRVLLIGEKPGDLIESDLVLNLSEPCALPNTDWIVPGKSAWDHWWSGDVKMDTATMKQYVQFAADMKFPYQLVDWQWYGSFAQPDSDITRINPNLDLPELRRFARERNVRLLVWLHSQDVDRSLKAGQLDAAFALYEQWGLAGVKIDFMDSDDQDRVNWYHTVTQKAAAHRLLVDFHGAYKPTGTHRTYPNQMTREGVLGEEYAKFSQSLTPDHDCTLPFTRMLAGPMDYTPGGFRNRSKAQWKQTIPTEVYGTRAHELAKFVIFESPLMVLCDHPDNYRNQPGLEFLRIVPTVWDDTKVLNGAVGDYIVMARKSGKDWFVGGMTNSAARTLQIPLTFVGKGTFEATIFADAPDAAVNAEHLSITKRTVRSGETLTIPAAPGGGVAIYLKAK